MKRLLISFALAALVFAQGLSPWETQLLRPITIASLQAHLSFLASDALEGRDTPSKGLEAAAEYIASQFRRAGLEPAGTDGSYFQVAPMALVTQPKEGFEVSFDLEGKTIKLPADKASATVSKPVELANLAILKVDLTDLAAIQALKPEDVSKKAIYMDTTAAFRAPAADRDQVMAQVSKGRSAVRKLQPALLLTPSFGRRGGPALTDPGDLDTAQSAPTVQLVDADVNKILREHAVGPIEGTVSVKIPGPKVEPIKLRNVAGILRGSDPVLKDTYVIISAHYDHVGINPNASGDDKIFNGANDNASGTTSVLELAEAFSQANPRPKRSILFITYFGEEKGLFGSRYYARNPIVPLTKTTANMNLEQMGRTDDNGGDLTGTLTASGFSMTSIGDVLIRESAKVDIRAYNDEKNSDAFFARSDNQALADAGVPAVTLTTAWTYPDYHRAGDHWDKINYENMVRAVKAVALSVAAVANDPKMVTWVESNPKNSKYVDAARKLGGQSTGAH
jgi:hypothetical protein